MYLEYDGDLYWLNLNHRGQLWINTREKLRAMFRPVHGQRVAPETPPEEKPAGVKPQVENAPPAEDAPPVEKATEPPEKTVEPLAPAAAAPSAPPPASNAAGPLPGGPELLDRLRPAMRRNRHGGGLSGSVSYLARAFRTEPRALEAAFEALGLALPSRPNEKPASVGIGPLVYWLNRDKTGQVWINAREKRDEVPPPPAAGPAPEPVLQPAPGAAEPPAETKPEAVAAASAEARPADTLPPAPPPAEVPPAAQAEASPLAAARLLLTETKRGGVAEELGRIAEKQGRSTDDLLAALAGAGLKVPEKAREKPVFVEHAGEILWLSRNARGQLWLNARASKFPEKKEEENLSAEPPARGESGAPAGRRPRAPRRRR